MLRRRTGVAGAVLAAITLLTGCSHLISGTATWPGARLEKSLLTAADFPAGVMYTRIIDHPGRPDNAGGPAPMLSIPAGCSDGLTDVIAKDAERGPGSAAKYSATYGGARIVMTVLTFPLDLDALAATASRCAKFDAYFDRNSIGIPITTVELPARPGQLVYQQTMKLAGIDSSLFMSFENVGQMAVFGLAFATPKFANPSQNMPKAELPQTFLGVTDKQAQRIESG